MPCARELLQKVRASSIGVGDLLNDVPPVCSFAVSFPDPGCPPIGLVATVMLCHLHTLQLKQVGPPPPGHGTEPLLAIVRLPSNTSIIRDAPGMHQEIGDKCKDPAL